MRARGSRHKHDQRREKAHAPPQAVRDRRGHGARAGSHIPSQRKTDARDDAGFADRGRGAAPSRRLHTHSHAIRSEEGRPVRAARGDGGPRREPSRRWPKREELRERIRDGGSGRHLFLYFGFPHRLLFVRGVHGRDRAAARGQEQFETNSPHKLLGRSVSISPPRGEHVHTGYASHHKGRVGLWCRRVEGTPRPGGTRSSSPFAASGSDSPHCPTPGWPCSSSSP